MRTNRLISRQEASELDLRARIALEARVTDAIGVNIQLPSIPPNWTFRDYSHRRPWRQFMFDFLGPLAGKTILDLGCGYNPTPVYFALAGAQQVIACDVSPRAVEFVSNLVRNYELQNVITTHCCPAESLPLNDDSIDLVHGEAVLHHLDLETSSTELLRVLKKGGRAAFKDPLGHNFLLETARDYLPYRWKHAVKGTDRPLRFSEIKRFGQKFSHCEARGFGLFSMLASYLYGRRDSRFQSVMHSVDDRVLRFAPWLQRSCRFVVTCLEK